MVVITAKATTSRRDIPFPKAHSDVPSEELANVLEIVIDRGLISQSTYWAPWCRRAQTIRGVTCSAQQSLAKRGRIKAALQPCRGWATRQIHSGDARATQGRGGRQYKWRKQRRTIDQLLASTCAVPVNCKELEQMGVVLLTHTFEFENLFEINIGTVTNVDKVSLYEPFGR